MAKSTINTASLTPAQSITFIKNQLKTNRTNIKKKFQPGKIIMFKYDAKDKKQTYDKTPLVMVLRSSKSYVLGLNFHWLPIPLRVLLIKKILSMPVNKKAIKNNTPLQFSYHQLLPFLHKVGYAPVIRLYIRKRISPTGVVIPDDQLMMAARTKSETFTSGRVGANVLYQRALKSSKKYRQTRTRRN